MGESGKVLYVVVVDDGEKMENGVDGKYSFRYARPVLQSTLQIMGCKASHAFEISQRVFELMRIETSVESLVPKIDDPLSVKDGLKDAENDDGVGKDNRRKIVPFELYKRRTTVVVRRETFLNVICSTLTEYKYVGPNQRVDLVLDCRIREKKESVTVMLCGTSGCGKSTLSSLLGSRLGVTTVVSTDSLRHMIRSFMDEKQNPLAWASTYHAGEYLDPVAVAEAKVKSKTKKNAGISYCAWKDETSDGSTPKEKPTCVTSEADGSYEETPFYNPLHDIHKRETHGAFAVRAKYMALDPAKNKYVKYFRNIRIIQEYLCNRADKHLVPKVNNTNVDKSVAAIHATGFSCLRRREAGERLYDAATNTVALVDEEYRNQCMASSLSSKGMFQLIQRKGSSRHLMALVNLDGSVARAWPVHSVSGNGDPVLGSGLEKPIGNPMYGPLKIGKAEPVNLQFGHFGISAWPSDGGTSRAGSVAGSGDDCRIDWTDGSGSKYQSSCSSPRFSDGPSEEPKEELSVHDGDEEADDLAIESDDDLSDDSDKQIHDEAGSVDDEYDDLATQYMHETGYWSDNDEPKHQRRVGTPRDKNLDLFVRCRPDHMKPPLCSYSSVVVERSAAAPLGNMKIRRRVTEHPCLWEKRKECHKCHSLVM